MTIALHDRSFGAFACWRKESFDFYDAEMRDYTPTSPPTPTGDHFADKFLAYYAQSGADTRGLFSILLRQELAEFVPQDCLLGSKVDLFIDKHAEILLLSQQLSRTKRPSEAGQAPSRSKKQQRSERDAAGGTNTDLEEYRPSRRALGFITTGGYLTLPDDRRTLHSTAELLNRGVPSGVKNVKTGHVRDAIRAFVRLHYRGLVGHCPEIIYKYARMHWQILDQLWLRTMKYTQSRELEPEAVMQLEATGIFFEWRREAELAAVEEFNRPLPLDGIKFILAQGIQHVRAAERRKAPKPIAEIAEA